MHKKVMAWYLSLNDFKEQKLFPENGNCKVIANPIFHPQSICLKRDGRKEYYHKDSIYGFKENNKSYRLCLNEGKHYQIMEIGEIVIYKVLEQDYSYKANLLIPQFYFSKDLSSTIYPLSIYQLKVCFPENILLHHYLNFEFEELALSTYNQNQKTYHINFLLKKLNNQ